MKNKIIMHENKNITLSILLLILSISISIMPARPLCAASITQDFLKLLKHSMKYGDGAYVFEATLQNTSFTNKIRGSIKVELYELINDEFHLKAYETDKLIEIAPFEEKYIEMPVKGFLKGHNAYRIILSWTEGPAAAARSFKSPIYFEKKLICASCGFSNAKMNKYCISCGNPLALERYIPDGRTLPTEYVMIKDMSGEQPEGNKDETIAEKAGDETAWNYEKNDLKDTGSLKPEKPQKEGEALSMLPWAERKKPGEMMPVSPDEPPVKDLLKEEKDENIQIEPEQIVKKMKKKLPPLIPDIIKPTRLFTIPTAEVMKSLVISFSGGSAFATAEEGYPFLGEMVLALGDISQLSSIQEGSYSIPAGAFQLQVPQEWTGKIAPGFPIVSFTAQGAWWNRQSAYGIRYETMFASMYGTVTKEYTLPYVESVKCHFGLKITDTRMRTLKESTLVYITPLLEKYLFSLFAGFNKQVNKKAEVMLEITQVPVYNYNMTGIQQESDLGTAWMIIMGSRYYMTNWLTIDAGVRYQTDYKGLADANIKIGSNITLPAWDIIKRVGYELFAE